MLNGLNFDRSLPSFPSVHPRPSVVFFWFSSCQFVKFVSTYLVLARQVRISAFQFVIQTSKRAVFDGIRGAVRICSIERKSSYEPHARSQSANPR